MDILMAGMAPGGVGAELHIGPGEAEHYVRELRTFGLEAVGTNDWFKQHQRLQSLNTTAHQCVMSQRDEFVQQFLVSHDKFGVIVHELLVCEVWKQHLLLADGPLEGFPEAADVPLELLDALHTELGKASSAGGEPHRTSLAPIHFILYHEQVLINLLEITMFHPETVLAVGDALVELVDYCLRKLQWLVADRGEVAEKVAAGFYNREVEAKQGDSGSGDRAAARKTQKEFLHQQAPMQFANAIACLGLLRYISDLVDKVPMGVLTRMLTTHDAPVAVVEILLQKPWLQRNSSGARTVLTDNTWIPVEAGDLDKLNKASAQAWLLLCNLLLPKECQQKYRFHDNNKPTIMKAKNLISEVLLDQLPPLKDMREFLTQLEVWNPPTVEDAMAAAARVTEVVPRLFEDLEHSYSPRWWSEFALTKALPVLVRACAGKDAGGREAMGEVARMYSESNVEDLVERAKCGNCSKPAKQRCSRCKNAWYCSRDCQRTAWKTHKAFCDKVLERQLDADASELD